MRTVSAAAAGKTNFDTDADVGTNDVGVGKKRRARRSRRPYDGIMDRARSLLKSNVAGRLAGITGRSPRTCERWLSGELLPDGEAALKLFFSQYGCAFLEARVAELSSAEQEHFWREMGRACKRAELRQRHAAAAKELADIEAERGW